jgi:hypothetical protein
LVDALDPLSAAFRFVNYPLDLAEEHPSKALANVTVERRKGGYVFRNRWQDGEDCVTTVFLDSNFVGGSWASLEAADLRIQGLGADWTVRGMGWAPRTATRGCPARGWRKPWFCLGSRSRADARRRPRSSNPSLTDQASSA